MKTLNKVSIVLICLLSLLLSSLNFAAAQEDEKAKVLSSQALGDFTKAKKIKKTGKTTLQVWGPYVEYANTVPDYSLRNTMLKYNNKLDIEYDEIWTWIRDDVFSPAEKKKYKGQFDIHKMYWKNNKVQAFTLEKYYVSNPMTKAKLGKHQITQVWDRDSILSAIGN